MAKAFDWKRTTSPSAVIIFHRHLSMNDAPSKVSTKISLTISNLGRTCNSAIEKSKGQMTYDLTIAQFTSPLLHCFGPFNGFIRSGVKRSLLIFFGTVRIYNKLLMSENRSAQPQSKFGLAKVVSASRLQNLRPSWVCMLRCMVWTGVAIKLASSPFRPSSLWTGSCRDQSKAAYLCTGHGIGVQLQHE